MKFTKALLLCSFVLLTVVSCTQEEPTHNDPPGLVLSLSTQLNPSGYAPLTAVLNLESSEPVQVEITVKGQNGTASDITQRFSGVNTSFALPILGLYPSAVNSVEIRLFDTSGSLLEERTETITTTGLIADMPQITVDVPFSGSAPVFNLVNYFGFESSFRPQRPFIFDQFGDIRWYLDFSSHPTFSNLFFDNGMTQLSNGNLLFGNADTQAIYEVDMLGVTQNSWSLQGNGFHHHVIEKPNGNLLVTINDASKSTVEDVIIEIDRSTGQFANTWDLNLSLDNTRRAWPTDLADLNIDWFHANAIEFSSSDESIIVSGRTQGIVKLNAVNEVAYILAPHREWGTSGGGTDLTQFLLTPLDANNAPITDMDVLDGVSNHPDFEWSWYQHSPILMPNGNLMVFDNGDNRNYTGAGPYSRAVEYEIDETNKTIKQVWQYGKERGAETYSRIVSKVSYVADNNSILFTPGAATDGGTPGGKVVEVDYNSKSVLFEATIMPPNTVFNISFHNVLRINLYD